MIQAEAVKLATEFLRSQNHLLPAIYSEARKITDVGCPTNAVWSIIFDIDDTKWSGHAVFIVVVNDVTGEASLFETL